MKPPSRQQIKTRQDNVDQFLQKLKHTPPATQTDGRGRLIFSLDATASRQPTWEQASQLQYNMFTQTRGLAQLDIQLVYYRGFAECKASAWVDNADKLCSLMNRVQCLAGHTQIARILKHALSESRKRPVQALVFVGDCMEEDIDTLGNLAGQLKLMSLPVFIFQEGHDVVASRAFGQIASLSGGAHCQFDQSSSAQLGQLLQAAAAYASGGQDALRRLANSSGSAARLLKQLT